MQIFSVNYLRTRAYYINMYELKLARGAFYRVKHGQTAADIESVLCIPVNGKVFEGMIIPIPQRSFTVYKADVGDTYAIVAAKFGVEEGLLREVNGGKPVYPTCRVFVPV